MNRHGRLSGIVAAGLVLAVANAGCFGDDDGTGPSVQLTYSLVRIDRQAVPLVLTESGVEITEGQLIWFTGGKYAMSYMFTATEGGSVTTVNRSGTWRQSDDQSDGHLRAFLMRYNPDRWGPDSSLPQMWQLDFSSDDGSVSSAVSQSAWIAIEEAGSIFEFTRE